MRSYNRCLSASHLIMVLALLAALVSCKGSKEDEIDFLSKIKGGETRATLSPVYFTGRVAEAYKIAKEIPEVLDSLYCYCDCSKHYGHKSLLTCYVDLHAANCDLCMNEAFMAYDLHKKGKDIVTIRKAVDKEFSG